MIKPDVRYVYPMKRSTLELGLSVFEGTAHRLGDMILFYRLCAVDPGPDQPPPRCFISCRDAAGDASLKVSRPLVTDQEVARLVRLLRAAGFPRRVPRIVPNKNPAARKEFVALDVGIDGHTAILIMALESAGFRGDDAEPLRGALRRLADLAAANGRPGVHALVDRLVSDRRDGGDREPSPDALANRAGDVSDVDSATCPGLALGTTSHPG
jgi:hypothetical protein